MTQLLQRFNGGQWVLSIVFIMGLSGQTLTAQNGPACSTFTNYTTANGLRTNSVNGAYAATGGGLSFCPAEPSSRG